MRKHICFLFLTLSMFAGQVFSKNGNIHRVEGLKFENIREREVAVWLPSDYNSAQKYAVLYMHDGQMLFDSTTTWNKQEWQVDEMMSKLQLANQIRPTIVVAVSNIPELRFAEYFPQKVVENVTKSTRAFIVNEQFHSEPLADKYLKFLVEELKPHIDSVYSTHTDAQNTFIMGSSMGGLISLYGLCEYPEVFGGAACLSMHSPMITPAMLGNTEGVALGKQVTSAFRTYLAQKLPDANTRKIYIDYGDQDLDSYYKPYQTEIDELLISLGWKYPFWETKEFKGENHSERAWAKRLDVPCVFLLN